MVSGRPGCGEVSRLKALGNCLALLLPGDSFPQVCDARGPHQPTGTSCKNEGHGVEVRGTRAQPLGTLGAREGLHEGNWNPGLSSRKVTFLSKDLIPTWLCLQAPPLGTADQPNTTPGMPRAPRGHCLAPTLPPKSSVPWVGHSGRCSLSIPSIRSRGSDGLGSPGRRLPLVCIPGCATQCVCQRVCLGTCMLCQGMCAQLNVY